MKKQVLLALFFVCIYSFQIKAQETHRKAEGFGIEVGVGCNTMNIKLRSLSRTDSSVSLTHLWMQPCLRLHYDVVLTKIGNTGRLNLKPFIGYYTFGGKVKPDASGYTEILSFSSIEAGAGITYDIKNLFQITPLIKGQYIIAASERFIRDVSVPSADLKNTTQTFSANAGLQIRFKYHRFTAGAEAWLGLTDFNKSKGSTYKENNYRVLIGYEF